MYFKTCKECKKEFPATAEFFHASKTNLYGVKTVCKKCFNIKNGEYSKKRYKENKEHVTAINKKYYDANKEKVLLQQKTYVQTDKGKLSNRICVKKWVTNNREKYNKYHETYGKAYVKTERGRMITRISQYKSQAKVLYGNKEDNFNIDDWLNLVKYFDNRCAYCGKETKLVQEHIIPLAKGGTYNKDNILCACYECNNNKRQQQMEKWYVPSFYYREKRFKKIKQYIKSVS